MCVVINSGLSAESQERLKDKTWEETVKEDIERQMGERRLFNEAKHSNGRL